MKKRLAAILKWFGIFILAFAVIYAGLMIWSAWKLRQAYAALEKDGRPMAMKQIRAAIKGSPDAYRAALVHQAAILLLKSKPGTVEESTSRYDNLFNSLGAASETVLRDSTRPETAIDADSLRKWFQDPEVSEILHKVETTIEERPCCFRMVDDYYRIDFRQHYGMANLAGILCAKAKLLADDGKTSEAWSTVIHGLSLADSLKTIPFGLERSRVRVAHQGLNVIQQLAGKSLPSQKERETLACLLSGFYDSSESLETSLDGRRLWMEEGWWKDAKERESSVSHFGNMRSIGFYLFSKADHAAYLDFFRQYANMAVQPYSAEKTLLMQNYPSSLPCWCVITRSDRTIDDINRLYAEFMKFRASTAVVRAGLAILYYRETHGKYPQDLAEAGFPKDPFGGSSKNADPFTGVPLIYKLTEKGFRIYSVGPDLKDSGGQGTTKFRDMDRDIVCGVPLATKLRDMDRDIVWEYQAP